MGTGDAQAPILRRSIGIVFSDGGLLALTSSMPSSGRAHGDEEVAAVLCDPDGAPLQFEESLLSTEYGEDGVQRRATLELWPSTEEMRPLRGAGVPEAAGEVSVMVAPGRVEGTGGRPAP